MFCKKFNEFSTFGCACGVFFLVQLAHLYNTDKIVIIRYKDAFTFLHSVYKKKNAYPIAITSEEFLSVMKLLHNVFNSGSKTSGGINS